jgi:hypothetical protein
MVPCRSECKAAWSMGSSPGRSVHACRDLVDPSASCPTDPRGECFFKISLGELGNCVADCSNHHDRDGHTCSLGGHMCSLGHQPSSLMVPRGSIWLRQRYPFIWIDGSRSDSRSVTRPADRLVVKGGSVPASFVLKLGTAADAGDVGGRPGCAGRVAPIVGKPPWHGDRWSSDRRRWCSYASR